MSLRDASFRFRSTPLARSHLGSRRSPPAAYPFRVLTSFFTSFRPFILPSSDPAPRAPTTHLVLSPIPPLQPTSANPLSRYVPPVKPPRIQPVEKLKFRNKPFGFSKADGEDGEEDVTMVEVEGEKVEKTKKRKAAAVEEKAVEGEGEKKKSKKSKKDQAVVA